MGMPGFFSFIFPFTRIFSWMWPNQNEVQDLQNQPDKHEQNDYVRDFGTVKYGDGPDKCNPSNICDLVSENEPEIVRSNSQVGDDQDTETKNLESQVFEFRVYLHVLEDLSDNDLVEWDSNQVILSRETTIPCVVEKKRVRNLGQAVSHVTPSSDADSDNEVANEVNQYSDSESNDDDRDKSEDEEDDTGEGDQESETDSINSLVIEKFVFKMNYPVKDPIYKNKCLVFKIGTTSGMARIR